MVASPNKKTFPSFILVFLFVIFEGVRVTLTPAFSEELTSRNFINLSTTQYSYLYVIFSAMAIISAILSGYFIKKRGLYSAFTFAIILDLGSMYFFGMALISYFFKNYAFVFLCIALGLSGAGFGMILPVVNTFVSKLFPKKTTTAILSIYLSLSIGSFVLNFFTDYLKRDIGIGISVLALVLIVFFFVFSFYEIFPKTFTAEAPLCSYKNIWTLILAMICVGALEGLFFNWSTLFASSEGINASHIYFGFLTFFTISQIVYAILLYWLPFNLFFILIPLLLVSSLIFGLFVFSAASALVVFCVVGFFLSANLPFTIAYGKKMFGVQPMVWGVLTASYEVGYGVSSYGLGFLSSMILNHFLLFALIFAFFIIVLNIITVINNRRVI